MPNRFIVLVRSSELFQHLYETARGVSAGVAHGVFDYDAHTTCYFVDWLEDQSLSEFVQESVDGSVQLACLDAGYGTLKALSDYRIKRAWFNPGGAFAPDRYPHHDAELRNLDEVSQLDALLDKPTLDQCLAWLAEWDVSANVRAHSDVVSWSAYVLAVKLRNKGIDVDPVLTHRGGMLHDIDKIATLKMDGAHGKMGASFLLEKGYPKLAEILREHIMARIMQPDAKDWAWEVKLVYFCDKLVEGNRLVTFDTRLNALKARYPHYIKPMMGSVPAIWAMSDEICALLGIEYHEGLIEMLRTYL